MDCIRKLYTNNNLFIHINVTLHETIISFILSIIISFIISIFLYHFKTIFKVIEPLLTMLNSTPKIAIGPIIIILFGANQNSIIITALSITLILNILTIYNSFLNTNIYLENYLKTLNVTKFQKLKYLVIPSSYKTLISSLKINISMTLIGVIMGEFLVSKAGIGYLIIYGTQVFNLTLVMSGIVILMTLSYILYLVINIIENKLKKYLT
ncbi:MAG: ABC transporter permease subunit [Bacilli bacterium]|nr:ABC transporter permease subunit [Bacilli bacterium]